VTVDLSSSLRVLERHQVARTRGVATVSMMVSDDPVVAISLFEAWAVASGRAPFVLRPEACSITSVMEQLVDMLCANRDLVRDAALFLAYHLDEEVEALDAALRNSGAHERDLLFRRMADESGFHVAASVAAQCVTESLLERRIALRDPAAFAGLLTVLRPDTRGAVLLQTSELPRAAEVLEQIAGVAPDLPLSLVSSPADWDGFARGPKQGRASAWLREGLIRVDGDTEHPSTDASRSRSREPNNPVPTNPDAPRSRSRKPSNPDAPRSRARNSASAQPSQAQNPVNAPPAQNSANPEPMSPSLPDSANDATVHAEGLAQVLLDPEVRELRERLTQAERGRSAAERLLYTALQADTALRGQFALNVKLPVPFGRRSYAEIDLLSRSLRIAIEVDGSYWHLRPDAYRNDRQKDAVLQRAGFFVFRVLAEDVAPDLPKILRQIADLADHQSRRDVKSP